MRGPSTAALLAAALLVGTTLSGCSSIADAGGAPPSDAVQAQPLPGSDSSSARLGIVTQRFAYLTLELPGRFGGASDEQISALTASIARVGDRSITTLSTPITLGASMDDEPSRNAAQACTEQRGSSIVITDVADASLVDCLIGNGSLVIDASAQPWDSTALADRAPSLWATATAPADVAERVLLQQAKAAALLPTGPATVVAGPDTVTQRVAATITTPELISHGLAPQTVTVGGQSTKTPGPTPVDEIAQLVAAVQEAISAGATGVVRPVSPAVYGAMTSNETFNRANSTILITSASRPGRPLAQGTLSSGTAPIGSRTKLLGWSPPSDGTAALDTPTAAGDLDAAAACQASLGQRLPPPGQQEAWPTLYRLCDALNLARTALDTPGALTPTSVRDAIWNASSQWRPAAVTANGWTASTYTGANVAQWFTWDEKCTLAASQAAIGCFKPTGPTLPLQPAS